MTEIFRSRYGLTDRREVQHEYGGWSAELAIRSKLYDYAVNPVTNDIEPLSDIDDTIRQLRLSGQETVADVGCADAKILKCLSESGHSGRLLGIDLSDAIFNQHGNSIDFVQADAQALPLSDNSIDVLSARRMLYHVPNPEVALAEFRRVLKPGGMLVIVTSGADNKKKHRALEKSMADFVSDFTGIRFHAPQPFAEFFGPPEVAEIVPRFFEPVPDGNRQYKRALRIDSTEAYYDYLLSVDSMRGHFWTAELGKLKAWKQAHKLGIDAPDIPPTQPWQAGLQNIVRTALDTEIKQYGRFHDRIDRRVYLFTNPK